MVKFRRLIQLAATIASNGYLTGFGLGSIYKGPLKQFCVPGLNCYSCPAALFACPLGALQNSLGVGRIPFYVIGFMMMLGGLLGRFICGFLCPFGFLQDLLYKIPLKKIKVRAGFKGLRKVKYVLLGLLVGIPLLGYLAFGLGFPVFCKYICPAGTLQAGIPLTLLREDLRLAVGLLFNWKLLVLAGIIVSAIVIYRPFCKILCPLGAIYGLFNKVSLVGMHYDKSRCTQCQQCIQACKMNVAVTQSPNDAECIRCGDCVKVCPAQCLRIGLTGANHKERPYTQKAKEGGKK